MLEQSQHLAACPLTETYFTMYCILEGLRGTKASTSGPWKRARFHAGQIECLRGEEPYSALTYALNSSGQSGHSAWPWLFLLHFSFYGACRAELVMLPE